MITDNEYRKIGVGVFKGKERKAIREKLLELKLNKNKD